MKAIAAVVVASVAAGGLFGAGLARGWWRMNHPDPSRFPVWGVDVSHHQGTVDWPVVARQPHIAFAYLVIWLEAVTGATGREPVIYATREAYDRFLTTPPLRRRLWIRDVWTEPRLPQSVSWTLWQFDARARLAGISGFVDLNVFQGDRVALQHF